MHYKQLVHLHLIVCALRLDSRRKKNTHKYTYDSVWLRRRNKHNRNICFIYAVSCRNHIQLQSKFMKRIETLTVRLCWSHWDHFDRIAIGITLFQNIYDQHSHTTYHIWSPLRPIWSVILIRLKQKQNINQKWVAHNAIVPQQVLNLILLQRTTVAFGWNNSIQMRWCDIWQSKRCFQLIVGISLCNFCKSYLDWEWMT